MSQPLQIVCPKCSTPNRVPKERLEDGGSCGKCRSKLFDGKPAELNSGNFKRFLAQTDIPVVVDFWAPWCGPCNAMAPAFSKAAGELEPNIRLAKLDTQKHQQIAAQLNIRSIPTLIVFKGGKEIDRISGALPANQLKKWIKNAAKS
ncbi:thioredoxin TrxC [Endozoicomonas sp. 8E]|uniref:thioredoxin TrxC n=1 Tax=Endozoicomonas sp. 8E TaxID=3035692 RepID=UPI002938EEB4|nr:thioredoxin TrxC [Endozoicomonas sp. 8E]WOG26627.1 thioredoxin TrxC [Endozoicomonas sp. 8E]